ncbi:hypothetical protein [Nocardioides sp. Kera G14]|uniref:hypothetical protein n=1 Tax=Nocardioides sp. Kera G14 TaxID=2884264 RepID=UPI001D0F7500|nr:hypothetical protein [Nocardioides sp. Kera G14]UDY23770.1 hypothetical protein LH076_00285 [Nocardioides sp. Kera G14]
MRQFRTILLPAAVLMLLAGVVAGVIGFRAALHGSRPSHVTVVDDVRQARLPDPGFFGTTVVVYGRADHPGVDGDDLGCTVRTSQGDDERKILLGDSVALGRTKAVSVDGQQLQPLFKVNRYSQGSYLSCENADSSLPLALGAGSGIAMAGPFAWLGILFGAVVFIGLGSIGLLLALLDRRTRKESP